MNKFFTFPKWDSSINLCTFFYIKKNNFFLEYVCTCDILKWIEKELTEKGNDVYGGLENRYKWLRGIVW
jgi:hypothetical protein